MAKALDPYLAIQQTLAKDAVEGVPEAARRIAAAISSVKAEPGPQIAQAAGKLAGAAGLKEARAAFKELSIPVVAWAQAAPPPGTSIVHCPMFDGSWVQRGTEVKNPYHGSEMLGCGRIIGGEGYRPQGHEPASHDHQDHAGHAH